MRPLLLAAALSLSLCGTPARAADVETLAASVDGKVQAWRRDLHQHPELGNQETRTAKVVADHLRALGLQDVRTGLGPTGVSAVLRGGKPGPRIAIRADMDALPVTEDTGLPFASKVTTDYRGTPVGVMHACGHDAHVAILMGVAEALASMKAELAGEVMFVFQPSEEGPPTVGEAFGAARMIQEGLFRDFKPEAIYGLHVWATLPAGTVGTRSGPVMAAADEWTLRIDGRQTHGSRPWDGVDPITVAAQVHLGWQSILARQVDITSSPVVLTTGAVSGGVRFNIVPDHVDMTGTLRTFDPAVRADVIKRMGVTAEGFAQASGARATLRVVNNAPVTANDVGLAVHGLASLRRVLGQDKVVEMPLLTVAEDFSQYATVAPTFFYFVGSTAPELDPKTAPANHSPKFVLDEAALKVGVRTMLQVTLDHAER